MDHTIRLKFCMRPSNDDIRRSPCWRFSIETFFVDQIDDFCPKIGVFAVFWLFMAHISVWVPRSASARILTSAVWRVCWGVGCGNWMKSLGKIDVFCRFFWISSSSLCHFRPFFSKWHSQGATPGQISSQQFHLACLQAFLVSQVLWKSFCQWIIFHCIHWSKIYSGSESVAVKPFWCRKITEACWKLFESVLTDFVWFRGKKHRKLLYHPFVTCYIW